MLRTTMLAGLAWLALSTHAQALTWHLQDVFLEDGARVTGSFDFNPVSGDFSNVSIETAIASYGTPLPFPYSKPSQLVVQDFTNTFELSLVFAHSLSDGALTYAILPYPHDSRELPRSDPDEVVDQSVVVRIVAGTVFADAPITPPVSAVPLPPALALFASGLGLMGLLGWRRKKQAA